MAKVECVVNLVCLGLHCGRSANCPAVPQVTTGDPHIRTPSFSCCSTVSTWFEAALFFRTNAKLCAHTFVILPYDRVQNSTYWLHGCVLVGKGSFVAVKATVGKTLLDPFPLMIREPLIVVALVWMVPCSSVSDALVVELVLLPDPVVLDPDTPDDLDPDCDFEALEGSTEEEEEEEEGAVVVCAVEQVARKMAHSSRRRRARGLVILRCPGLR